MSKDIYVRFGKLYEKFDEWATPTKISVPDDSLILKCDKDIWFGKHTNSFNYVLVSKSITKRQCEKLEKTYSNTHVLTKIHSGKYMSEYVKFNGYSLVAFTDCLISEFQQNNDNIISIRVKSFEEFNQMVFAKPIYLAYIHDYEISRVIRIESMNHLGTFCCSICDNLNNTITSSQEVNINKIWGFIDNDFVRINPQPYCKDLFDEIMYNVLSSIYDGFKEYRNKYDLSWLKKNITEVPVNIIPLDGTSEEESSSLKELHIDSPNVGYWEDIFKFKKRLPKNK